MNRVKQYLSILMLAVSCPVLSQDGMVEDFNDNTLTGWTWESCYQLTETEGQLRVNTYKTGAAWEAFVLTVPTMNLASTPYVKVKLKSNANVDVRIDLRDASGKVTNQTELKKSVTGNVAFQEYTYDFSGLFYQQYPTNAAGPVDATQITALVFILNPGSSFSGMVYLDDLLIGTETGILPPPGGIYLNQVGFYPDEIKRAVITDPAATDFQIIDAVTEESVYYNFLDPAVAWSYSGETVRMARFSEFDIPGLYKLFVPGVGYSHEFEIKDQVHLEAGKAVLKSYYYQRASTEITSQHGGQWARSAGHPDNVVYVHSSAATAERPEGTVISAPKGWYDAGDYGKYVVNSGIATYQILALYEHFPAYFDTLDLNIPESGDQIPDILDEALWNLRWMLKMQDTDGGVYHKLTGLGFDGNIMPSASSMNRYVIGKSTQSTLDFAAVMAQASRIFRNFETELPQLADSMLNAAISAYDWAEANPNLHFSNPTGVSTGAYGDWNDDDEFLWAASELLITTGDLAYNSSSLTSFAANLPGWQDVKTLGLVSLVHNRLIAPAGTDTTTAKSRIITLANTLLNHQLSSAYNVAMGTNEWDFQWGSNAVAGNQGMILLQAYELTGDRAYLQAAISNLDYVLGRNATNYSFVTGYGDNPAKNPHHRPSYADNIDDPVPGPVVGGPNPHDQSDCPEYPSESPAKKYLDGWCSYATNENAINYNSAVAYLINAVEAVRQEPDYLPLGTEDKTEKQLELTVFPNPASSIITVRSGIKAGIISVSDISGRIKMQEELSGKDLHEINIESLEPGVYILKIQSDKASGTKKLIVR